MMYNESHNPSYFLKFLMQISQNYRNTCIITNLICYKISKLFPMHPFGLLMPSIHTLALIPHIITNQEIIAKHNHILSKLYHRDKISISEFLSPPTRIHIHVYRTSIYIHYVIYTGLEYSHHIAKIIFMLMLFYGIPK